MTSVICALYNSVERNKERTANITNSMCVLFPSSTCDGGSQPWFGPQHLRVIGRRIHEFSHASDHSTHCWAHIVVLVPSVPGHRLTGCQSSKLIHQILLSTFLQEFGLVFLQVRNDLRWATRLIQASSITFPSLTFIDFSE